MDLPDDVFQAGEVKPQRIAKKKASKQVKKETASNGVKDDNKKRKLDEDQSVGATAELTSFQLVHSTSIQFVFMSDGSLGRRGIV